ncbi:MAG: HD domain-containing protein [Patescibacteria group bacterium]|nr:HD domain-containing protein [Patescibacteria group bacterium]
MKDKDFKGIANLIYEAGILAKTPRSGFHFLGTGDQTVAEHTNRVVIIGYILASMEDGVDVLKVMKMCMLHDLAEGRTSDLNYVHQKYVTVAEDQAVHDLASKVPFGKDIETTLDEYEERASDEAKLAKDADQLEWLISLKEQYDLGNTRARTWFDSAVKRLKTGIAQKLAEVILDTESDDWWFNNKNDDWWVNRNGGKKKTKPSDK